MSELPEWVVERCRNESGVSGTTVRTTLAEFLRIIEERGLRVVPNEPTERMHVKGETMHWDCDTGHSDVWEAMIEAAPPLAELLREQE